MDERYRDVSPLRVNTIETLYPELKKSDNNKSNNEQNAVYFNIDGNNIEIVARILFYDDYAQNFIENSTALSKTYEEEYCSYGAGSFRVHTVRKRTYTMILFREWRLM